MLKFILIILVIFFVFGKVIKYALKYWVISNVQKQQQYNYSQPTQRETRKEGSIHIDNEQKKSKNKGGNFSDGEYIDYEVVK
jgi:biopolymer transport protein ExbD